MGADPWPKLTERAHGRLCARLEKVGNILSPKHRAALLVLCRGLTVQAFGPRQRIAYPLPTGMGKTQAAVAWCVALHALGMRGTTIAVCASQVEALCRFKRDLMAGGIPADLIGLRHSYKHDPAWLPQVGERPPEGFASEPSDLDAHARPFFLATHQRVRGTVSADSIKLLAECQGMPRNLVIWDESLMVSESRAWDSRDLASVIRGLGPFLLPDGEARPYLEQCSRAIEDGLERLQRGEQATELALPTADLGRVAEEVRAASRATKRAQKLARVEEVLDFLGIAGLPLSLAKTDQGEGAIWYRIAVPEALESVAVLDASYPIRELCHMDRSLKRAEGLPAEVKRFDQVEVRHWAKGSGRDSVEKDLKKTKSGGSAFAGFVVQAVQEAGPQANVLVFTFKQKSARDVHCIDTLRAALAGAGIDPDALVRGRHRVSFLAWGNETSLSDYQHCSHVVFAGVLRLPHLAIAAAMVGQADDLALNPTTSQIRDMEASEAAHSIYQALSRGTCRVVENGQAKPMTVWLPLPPAQGGRRVIAALEQVIPGARWSSWQGKEARETKADQLADLIRQHLGELGPDVDRVSARAIKEALGVTGHKDTFSAATEKALAALPTWSRQGRSLVRSVTT